MIIALAFDPSTLQAIFAHHIKHGFTPVGDPIYDTNSLGEPYFYHYLQAP